MECGLNCEGAGQPTDGDDRSDGRSIGSTLCSARHQVSRLCPCTEPAFGWGQESRSDGSGHAPGPRKRSRSLSTISRAEAVSRRYRMAV